MHVESDINLKIYVDNYLHMNSFQKIKCINMFTVIQINPGIESEPILNEETGKYIGYQAKFFTNDVAIVRSKSRRKRRLNIIKGN